MAARSKEMEIAIKIAGKVESSFKNALGQAAKGIKSITKTVAAASTAAVLAIGGLGLSAVNVGREFEEAMSQVSATMLLDKSTEEGRQNFETLEEAARKCGRETAFSATEAAEALNYLALAGYSAEDAATALPTVLALAGAGAMDLAVASDMVTDSMAALGIAATQENLTEFSDKIAKTASVANANVAQMGEAIITVGGTAKDLKGGTTELNAALGILADVGIKGSEGGTKLRNTIMSLTAPTDKARDALNSIGVSAFDSEGNMRGLDETLGDINKAMQGMNLEEQKNWLNTVFNKQDLAAVSGLLAATSNDVSELSGLLFANYDFYVETADLENFQNILMETDGEAKLAQQLMQDFGFTAQEAAEITGIMGASLGDGKTRFEELTEAIEDSAGACEDMYAIQLDNLNGDIAILQSALSDLGISVYKDLNAPLREMTQLGTSMVEQLNAAYAEGGMEGMVEAVGGCISEVVNVIAEYAPKVVSMAVNLVGSFVSGITENSGTIAGAAGEVLSIFINGLFKLVPQVILAGIDIILQLAQSMISQLPQLLDNGTQAIVNFVAGIIQRLPQVATTALTLVQTLVTGIGNNLPTLISAAIQLIGSLILGIVQMLPALLQMGIQLLMSLANGIVANLPLLLQVASQVITSLLLGLGQMIPQIIQAGIQIIITLLQGIISNLGNIVQAAVEIVIALAAGLIQAIPALIAAIPQLIGAIIDTILNTDWLQVGIDIIIGIIKGIMSTGKSLWNAIKSLFKGGGEDIDVSEAGSAATESYAQGIQSSAGAASNAVSTLSSSAFGEMDFTGATAAGAGAGEAFTAGLTDGMEGFVFDTSTIGMDTEALTENMNLAGADSMDALSTGISGNSDMVMNAVETLGNNTNTALDASWSTAEGSARSAMEKITQTVTTAAQTAANAIKSAFENMTITIPKPRIPVISVAYNTETYGEGGSVKVPKFDVSWNALGGIFTKPTILGSAAGAQGVGEAGAEAILPLDTLWKQMRQIVEETVRRNSGTSVIESLLEKLQDIGSGGSFINRQPQPTGAGGPDIVYSPIYNLYGSATKEDAVEAGKFSQAEFDKMMKKWNKENNRKNF